MKDRLSVLLALQAQGVIPVFHHPDPQVCGDVIAACADGGSPCVEFTNRGDFAVEVFRQVSQRFARERPEVILGVGSIVEAPTAALYLAYGANFVVGPMLNPEVARLCNRRQVAYSPGCGSATEISQAQELGCEIVKLFPGASVGGPEFVRNILGPMPWTKLMPTGGVEATEESFRAWFGAGVVACGLGSNLISKALLDARDYAGIARRVRETVGLVRQVRSSL
jgi:2-dehydro-3-deoxyphosphogluconate aldolase/(4S)-4-hydroxy-2-oxoglutarate aldolase